MNFVSVIKSVFGKKSLIFSINNENELRSGYKENDSTGQKIDVVEHYEFYNFS